MDQTGSSHLPKFPSIVISESKDFGRFLLADEDIPPLTTILVEVPMVAAAADSDEPTSIIYCCSCFCSLEENSVSFCQSCQWPVCSQECANATVHSGNECEIFRENQIPFNTLRTCPALQKSLLVFRCLLLQTKNPENWHQLLKFQDHNDIRQTKLQCVEKDARILSNIALFLGIPTCDKEMEHNVLRISGILDVNAFTSVKTYGGKASTVQCIFKTCSLFSHSCIPNSNWILGTTPQFKMTVRSSIFIPKGEMLTIPYSDQDNLCGTLQRIVSTEDTAHFSCKCIRCSDPTEAGTFVSAIRCDQCHTGYLLPLNPINPASDWICSWTSLDSSPKRGGCLNSVKVSRVVLKLCNAEKKLDDIKSRLKSPHPKHSPEVSKSLQKLTNLRRCCENTFFRNHYLVQKCIFLQIKLIANRLESLGDSQLETFVQDTQSLLAIANILNPGYCRYRATLQYYLALGLRQTIKCFSKLNETNSLKIPTSDDKNPGSINFRVMLLEVKELQEEVGKYFAYASDSIQSSCIKSPMETGSASPRRFSAKSSFFQRLEAQRDEVDAILQATQREDSLNSS